MAFEYFIFCSSAINEQDGQGVRTYLIVNTPMGKPKAQSDKMTIQGTSPSTLQVKGNVQSMFSSEQGTNIISYVLFMDGDLEFS